MTFNWLYISVYLEFMYSMESVDCKCFAKRSKIQHGLQYYQAIFSLVIFNLFLSTTIAIGHI